MVILSLPTIAVAMGVMWNVTMGGRLLFEPQKQKKKGGCSTLPIAKGWFHLCHNPCLL